jgi:hypothetical protein
MLLVYVRGSVHHSIIHIGNPTRCNSVPKFYLIFIWSSTCFGRHTSHHQEPKTALAASGFAYVEDLLCRYQTSLCYEHVHLRFATFIQQLSVTCTSLRPTTLHVCKTRGCQCSFRLLMMAGVSPETCWASYKYEIKFWYTVASCCISYMKVIDCFKIRRVADVLMGT